MFSVTGWEPVALFPGTGRLKKPFSWCNTWSRKLSEGWTLPEQKHSNNRSVSGFGSAQLPLFYNGAGGSTDPSSGKRKITQNSCLLFLFVSVGGRGGVGAEVRSLLTSDRYLERVSGSRSCFPQAHGSAHLSDPTPPTPPRGGHAWERGLKRAIPLIYDPTQLQDTSSSGMGFCFRGAPRQTPPPASCQRRFKVSAI